MEREKDRWLSSRKHIDTMKLKPLSPTLREKKRYVAFEVIGGQFTFAAVSRAIWEGFLNMAGTVGCAKAGIWLLADKFDEKKQRGVIRVANRELDTLRAALLMITEISEKPVIIRTLGASGMLNKCLTKI